MGAMSSVMPAMRPIGLPPSLTFASAARELDQLMSRLPTKRLEALLSFEQELLGQLSGRPIPPR
jgi:hypothetical protein